MFRTTPAGSVQLQDYYIHPEKMGASRKDLADAIQSYSDNDSQKNGEPFFHPLLMLSQGHPDVPLKHPDSPISALSSRWEDTTIHPMCMQ